MWTMRKDPRAVVCALATHPQGWELTIALDGERIPSQTRVCPTQEDVFTESAMLEGVWLGKAERDRLLGGLHVDPSYQRAGCSSMALVARKACNCLIPTAEPDLLSVSPPTRFAIESVLSGFRAAYGGLWVGGSAELTTTVLSFQPNAANRAVHKGNLSFSLPLIDIVDVAHRRRFLTGILSISTRHGSIKMRCFGARQFGAAIAHARSEMLAARNRSE